MKDFNKDFTTEGQKEIAELFAYWLSGYTFEVIKRVMIKRNEIINNEFAMNMLKELKERGEKEKHDFAHSIGSMLYDWETFGEYDPHNHPLTHADSYRDILYDMYIKQD